MRGLREWTGTITSWALGRRGRWRQVLLWTVVALVCIRLLAPVILVRIANATLAEGEEVRGSLDDLSFSLLACNYTVHGLRLRNRHDDGQWRPLLDIGQARCDLEWGPLLTGSLVGDVTVSRAVFHVFAKPTSPKEPPSTSEPKPPRTEPASPPWSGPVRTVVRARLNAVTLTDGEVRFRDEKRGISGQLDGIQAWIGELNIPKPALTHRSPFHLDARTPGQGALRLDGEADLLAAAPTFLVRAKLEGMRLPELNPIAARLGSLAFASGTFSGYAEVVGDGRRLGGYLKVLFHHLELSTFGEEAPGKGTGAFWAMLIGAALDILENTEERQHAARIPLTGALIDPDTDIWTAIGTALTNAFVNALAPGFERPADK